MTSIGIAELKASLSKCLARVKAGEEVLITERGQPIARILPLVGVASYEPRIARLVSMGRLRLPEEPMDVETFLALPWPEDPHGSVLAELLAERKEGRSSSGTARPSPPWRSANRRPCKCWPSSARIPRW